MVTKKHTGLIIVLVSLGGIILLAGFLFLGGRMLMGDPLTDYATVEQAQQQVDFPIRQPQALPEGYTLKSVSTLTPEIVQIVYEKVEGEELTFRASPLSSDISGDYLGYDYEAEKVIGGVEVKLRGDGEDALVGAIFVRDELQYSLQFSKPVAAAQMEEAVASVG